MTTQLDAVIQEQLPYGIGDTVVPPVHGIGVITRLEETRQAEQSRLYYVMDIHDKCTLWVPVDTAAKSGMRSVVSASGFRVVSGVLSSAAQPLNEQARDRQIELGERFSQGTLEAICSIIRDLSVRGLSKRLNESDTRILKRARKLLLDEWVVAMNTVQQEAQSQLSDLLDESAAVSDLSS